VKLRLAYSPARLAKEDVVIGVRIKRRVEIDKNSSNNLYSRRRSRAIDLFNQSPFLELFEEDYKAKNIKSRALDWLHQAGALGNLRPHLRRIADVVDFCPIFK
jgi:hypothetical protein